MRKTFSVLTALLAFMATLPITAPAGDVIHIKGQAAFATFQSSDDLGCASNYVQVQVHETDTRSSQQPRTTTLTAFLDVEQWDNCTQTGLLEALGWDVPLPDGALQVAHNLNSATLDAPSLKLFDYVSQSTVTVDVHLTWTATDARTTPSFYHTASHIPGYIYNYHSTGVTRSAQVSGSVSIGSVSYTPIPTSDGQFGTATGGEVTIYKKP